MQKSKEYALLAMAMKAGKLSSGAFLSENAIRGGQAKLVIVSEDASANTRKKFSDKAAYRSIPLMTLGNSEALGNLIGRTPRTVLTVNDEGFAKAILTAVQSEAQPR